MLSTPRCDKASITALARVNATSPTTNVPAAAFGGSAALERLTPSQQQSTFSSQFLQQAEILNAQKIASRARRFMSEIYSGRLPGLGTGGKAKNTVSVRSDTNPFPKNQATQHKLRQAMFGELRQILSDARFDTPGSGHESLRSNIREFLSDLRRAQMGEVNELFNKEINKYIRNVNVRSIPSAGPSFVGASGSGTVPKVTAPRIKARAKGGPVNSGDPYIVGEKGPELFVPKKSGKIIPNFARETLSPNYEVMSANQRKIFHPSLYEAHITRGGNMGAFEHFLQAKRSGGIMSHTVGGYASNIEGYHQMMTNHKLYDIMRSPEKIQLHDTPGKGPLADFSRASARMTENINPGVAQKRLAGMELQPKLHRRVLGAIQGFNLLSPQSGNLNAIIDKLDPNYQQIRKIASYGTPAHEAHHYQYSNPGMHRGKDPRTPFVYGKSRTGGIYGQFIQSLRGGDHPAANKLYTPYKHGLNALLKREGFGGFLRRTLEKTGLDKFSESLMQDKAIRSMEQRQISRHEIFSPEEYRRNVLQHGQATSKGIVKGFGSGAKGGGLPWKGIHKFLTGSNYNYKKFQAKDPITGELDRTNTRYVRQHLKD